MSEKTVWGIHAGRHGVADSLFLTKGVIALGWSELGDMSKVPANRDAFKEKIQVTYPNFKPGQIPNAAGQPYRFVNEVKVGDLIVYPSKMDRQIHIGEVVGKYEYRTDLDSFFPNVRSVKWVKHLPRTAFSQGALYETGSAMSFFQIKNYSDEFISALEEKKTKSIIPPDESVSVVISDIEDQTRDFVIKQLAKNLKGLAFEEFVAHLLEKMGYRARLTRTNEASVDIIAHKDNLGFEPPIIKVQVKSS